VTLQWATYRDASDQTSLSRIWGGIHPPADDIPGRWIGEEIAYASFALAERHFRGRVDALPHAATSGIYPNPVRGSAPVTIELARPTSGLEVSLFDVTGRRLRTERRAVSRGQEFLSWNVDAPRSGVYFVRVAGDGWESSHKVVSLR